MAAASRNSATAPKIRYSTFMPASLLAQPRPSRVSNGLVVTAYGSWPEAASASDWDMPDCNAARYAWKVSGETARTSKFLIEWYVLHSSAHRPTYAPSLSTSTVTSNWLRRSPGNTSRLNSSSGTQNEWITSRDSSSNRTRCPVGITSTGISVLEPV